VFPLLHYGVLSGWHFALRNSRESASCYIFDALVEESDKGSEVRRHSPAVNLLRNHA
jgi:hypothetical protein